MRIIYYGSFHMDRKAKVFWREQLEALMEL